MIDSRSLPPNLAPRPRTTGDAQSARRGGWRGCGGAASNSSKHFLDSLQYCTN